MGKRKLSLRKHPQDEQIQAISAARQQRDRWTERKRREEEERGGGTMGLVVNCDLKPAVNCLKSCFAGSFFASCVCLGSIPTLCYCSSL